MATRSSPVSEARGGAREELPRPRPGAVSGTSSPISKEGGCTAARRPKERFYVQGREGRRCADTRRPSKEQRLRFAGGTVKRYPTSKVRETLVNLDN